MATVKEKWTEMSQEKLLQGCIKTEREYLKEYDADLRKGEEWGPDSAEDLSIGSKTAFIGSIVSGNKV